ncbi:radical SAM family heme chaperone HemW [Methylovirgula sp. 4M-Z18]|uniref:radical SAM family heme chaperone HemW n=1 Tax=Methylovirgula sp. 4M-Z18 TaxID=2293567 RepID=UPI000E2F656D|nr:radical SAM family heme chaperone HemW [Methylovirgula sp. 4M-Z18]RFB79231.1 coproporphyrinogen III oxidase [Methylovirgula sp. 4M-Z18]
MSVTPGFGVYVHWPFCLSKCPYCDFNSHVRHAPVDQPRFVEAFRREIAHRASVAPGRTVTSVFFGGGTPSLMQPQTVAAIIEAIGQSWTMAEDAEITLEANPTSVEADRFRGYRSAGVNRVSLGVQALNDADLKALGRMHSVEEAMRAVAVAEGIFDRSSFDLIYARPHQTPESWRAELKQALTRASGHLSLYQLTIEPGTMFERLHRAGKLAVPDPDLGRAFWDVTQEMTAAAGFPAYEISNHARPGEESRHNLVYWHYGEYAGIGPGAHGRLRTNEGRFAMATEKHPETWLQLVERQGHGLIENDLLTPEQEGDEFLLMGLRLREGIDTRRYADLTGHPLKQNRIDLLQAQGMLDAADARRLRVTPEGFPVLNAVIASLVG